MWVTVIVPCYNEESRGVDTSDSLILRLDRIKRDIGRLNIFVKVLFVDDCSTDNTAQVILDYINSCNLEFWGLVRHLTNKGKGEAIRTGIKYADSDFIGFIDADLSTSLSYLKEFETILNTDTCYIASRYMHGSQIVNKRSFARNTVSKISRLLLSLLFGLGVTDTQCGFKIFPADILKKVNDGLIESRWLFDIELLYIMKVSSITIKEFPVVWYNMENESTLKLGSSVGGSLRDLIVIWLHRGRLKRLCK